MNDAQTWTLIAGFLAITVAMNTMLLRVLRTEIGSVRTEIGSLRTEIASELTTVRTELKAEIVAAVAPVREDIARLTTRVDHLDDDVQTVFRRLWGDGTAGI